MDNNSSDIKSLQNKLNDNNHNYIKLLKKVNILETENMSIIDKNIEQNTDLQNLEIKINNNQNNFTKLKNVIDNIQYKIIKFDTDNINQIFSELEILSNEVDQITNIIESLNKNLKIS